MFFLIVTQTLGPTAPLQTSDTPSTVRTQFPPPQSHLLTFTLPAASGISYGANTEYWLRFYNPQSYILILDFRDTFFQKDPFLTFGPFASREPKYELHVFAENFDVGRRLFESV